MPRTLLPFAIVAALVVQARAGDDALFTATVEPILRERCYKCHSHEAGKMKGGLTLDSRSGWQQGGNSGVAIVPGKLQESLLITAIRHTDRELKMPEEKLPAAEIAAIEEWVKRGAPDPRAPAKESTRQGVDEWWAVRNLAKPPVPQKSGAHPVDAFVRAKLAEHGLDLSPEADRRTLIRRLTFDLLGLPPTPAEVDAFIEDKDPRAYEKLVDRLLASPRYGEQWARHWLDVAHYGESNGFGMDRPRLNAWPYRDYVIRAFNDDKPYARFVQEQLAADALFPGEPALTPALGFVAAGPFNQSALAEQVDDTDCKRIALNLDRDDMVSSVAATFLSVTLHCARCHEHKFDPISQRDYYRMQAAFAGVVRGEREFDPDAARQRERERWTKVKLRLDAGEPLEKLDAPDRTRLAQAMEPLLKTLLAQESVWQILDANLTSENAKTIVKRLPDGSSLFAGECGEKDVYSITTTVKAANITALRLEVFADDALPHRGPGRNPENGNLHLSEIKVSAAPADAPEKISAVKIKTAIADFSQAGWEIAKAIDGKADTAWGIHPQEGRSHQAVFVFDKPLNHTAGTLLTVRLEQSHGRQHVIGRLRISTATAANVATQKLVSPDVLAQLKTPADNSSATHAALAPLLAEEILSAFPAPQKVWAVGAGLVPFRRYKPPKEPYPIHILARGDINRPGAEVGIGALDAVRSLTSEFSLPNPKDEAARRAALVTWIMDPKNPLTWRSIVNRVWLWHFGRGLVETPNDFGKMGGTPTHPELLDWLACQFRDGGGSLKDLHRLILTSATYRQSVAADGRRRADPERGARNGERGKDETAAESPSALRVPSSAFQSARLLPSAATIDGDNRLLWRGTRRRLDAEQIRDALLAVSGRIDLTEGGPSAMQFGFSDPNKEVSPRIDYEGFDPDAPASNRRSVYRFIFRNVNDPLLDAFDAADPSLSVARRTSTTTALQALSLFNNRFVLRQCEHLASRLGREADGIEMQIVLAYRLLFSRTPDDGELRDVSAHARKHGLANACRVLVNSSEFLFVP